MSLHLYNTLSNSVERFKPLRDPDVKMYCCGLTVYNYAHIGNLRAFIFADVLRRSLEFLGYRVTHVQNVTDVGHLVSDGDDGEDKMMKASRLQKKDPWEIAKFYEEEFIKDETKLHILPPHQRPRATEHLDEMKEMVEVLLEKGIAYEISDGIYFDITKFPEYFKLSGNKLDDLVAGARVSVNDEKRNPGDFALWKKAEPNHIMQWDAFGFKGYPGWHIECSAMSRKYLGDSFDIHTGGEDNIFPHHECEIAQSESVTGKPMARFWMHTRHLQVEGRKMAKSAENFFILSDIEKKGYEPRAFRYLCLSSHYRHNMNFTWDAMEQAKNSLERIDTFIQSLQGIEQEGPFSKAISERLNEFMMNFVEAIEDDLNMPEALKELFNLIKEFNTLMAQDNLMKSEAESVIELLKSINEVFAVMNFEAEVIPEDILQLAKDREQARTEKNFARADEIRDELASRGYVVEDGPEGYKVVRR